MNTTCALGISADMLSDWRSRALDRQETARIAAHVMECQACQGIINQHERIAMSLKQLPVYPTGSAVWAAVSTHMHSRRMTHQYGFSSLSLGGVVALVLLVTLSFVLIARQGRGHSQTPIPTRTPTIGAQTPTPISSSTPPPVPFSGTPTYINPMTADLQDGWDTTQSYPAGNSCQFASDGYHVAAIPAYLTLCTNPHLDWHDFAIQVEMTFTKGNATDRGGITFRSAGGPGESSYQFDVSADGRYYLARCEASNCSHTLVVGVATHFHQGLHQTNTLGVVARGTSIAIYLNHILLQNVTDSRFSQGFVGLYGSSNLDQVSVEVVYQNFEEWAL